METIRRYGWRPSRPDHRNFKYSPTPHAALPASVDLRKNPAMPAIWDQGELGSCTAHGGGALHCYMHNLNKAGTFMPSRLGIYYCERDLEGTVKEDAGASVADCLKVLNKTGAGHEKLWPYNIAKFKQKPPKQLYLDAAKYRVQKYEQVDNTNATLLKTALAAGKPVVFGFTVYESFEAESVAKTGVVPMPGKDESVLGGHCVLLVGYDDSKKQWIVRNSWGTGWGDQGYCYFPYAFLTNADLASDFWVADVVA
jgi:C1A family cysteine protease